VLVEGLDWVHSKIIERTKKCESDAVKRVLCWGPYMPPNYSNIAIIAIILKLSL